MANSAATGEVQGPQGPQGIQGPAGVSGTTPSGTGFVRVTAGVLENPSTITLDTDGTLAANSDTRVASQKADKTYADTKAPASRNINTTAPVTGGGNLSADRTIAVSAMTGDAGTGGTSGVVPAPGAGDTAANKFLKANATWAEPTALQTGGVPNGSQILLNIAAGAAITATDNGSGTVTIAATNPPGLTVPAIIQAVYARGNTASSGGGPSVTVSAPAPGNTLVFIAAGSNSAAVMAPPATVSSFPTPGVAAWVNPVSGQGYGMWFRQCIGGDPTSYQFTAQDWTNLMCIEVHGLFTLGEETTLTSTSSSTDFGNGNLTHPVYPSVLAFQFYEWDGNVAISSTTSLNGWSVQHDFSAGSPTGNHYAILYTTTSAGQALSVTGGNPHIVMASNPGNRECAAFFLYGK